MPLEQRREAILDAALELFSTQGVGGVTMEALAGKAEVTKPVVYGAFPNAPAVLEALIRREQQRAFEQATALLPTDADLTDPEAVTVAGLHGFFAAVRERPATWQLFLSGANLPKSAAAATAEARRYLVDQLASLAQVAMADRPSGPLDPELTAQLMVAGMENGARLVIEDPEAFSDERLAPFVTALVRAFIQG